MRNQKMKSLYHLLNIMIAIIAVFVFLSGVVLTGLGVYDFFHTFSYLDSPAGVVGLLAVGLLQAVDLFLMAIVFFVFSLGVLILFNDGVKSALDLPGWLRIESFMELKVILWEAILTTMVISFVANLVRRRLDGEELGLHHLILPGAIFVLAASLYLLKKGGEHRH